MSEFLNAVKADLLDRRMLPLLVLAGVASRERSAMPCSGAVRAPRADHLDSRPVHVTGIAVSQAPANPNEAVAETTNWRRRPASRSRPQTHSACCPRRGQPSLRPRARHRRLPPPRPPAVAHEHHENERKIGIRVLDA